jgi:hypothetical protein
MAISKFIRKIGTRQKLGGLREGWRVSGNKQIPHPLKKRGFGMTRSGWVVKAGGKRAMRFRNNARSDKKPHPELRGAAAIQFQKKFIVAGWVLGRPGRD